MSAVSRNQHLIDVRRKQEAKYRQMDTAIAKDRQILQIASFETGTTNKINRRLRQERFNELKRQQDEMLQERREKLAEMFQSEMNDWQKQVLSKIETPEDRKQRIRERAYALKDMREQARQQFVQEKYDQQWRDANDDARSLDTKALTLYMSKERLAQIEEKRRLKEKLTEEEDLQYAEWNRRLDEMAERDRQKKEAIRQADVKTKQDLANQIAENTKRKQNHYLQSMADDQQELEQLRKAVQDEEEIQRHRKEDERQRGREIYETNENYKRFVQEERENELRHDAILLEYALRKERETIEAEEMKKRASLEAANRYRTYLEEQMQKEAIDTAFVDEFRRKDEERVWKARDDALNAREEARAYLMKMVDEGRKEQIYHKQRELEREREEGKRFANKFLDEARHGVELERMEAERRRQIAIENSKRLKEQIDHRYQQREMEKQEEYLQDKQMQYIEKNHRQKLSEQGGVLRLNRPLKQSQWYS